MTALVVCAVSGVSTVSGEVPTPIELSDLPEPPAEIQQLIQSGRVSLEAGQRDESKEPSAGPRLAAETRFQIEYDYSSRSRWRVEGGSRRIAINVRIQRVSWKPKHTVWFRRRPATTEFWSNVLVLHEMDHVRISNDPRLAARFEELLRERSALVHPIRHGDVVNQRLVDRLVGEHVEKVFSEIADLISIRYRELDRVTNHGRRAVPADSPLQRWLSSSFERGATSSAPPLNRAQQP